jgi:chitin synthase
LQSWGTKGSDKVSDDLGVVKSDPKNHDEIEVDELSPEDLNLAYDAELRALDSKPPPENNAPNAEQKQEDYYKVSLRVKSLY